MEGSNVFLSESRDHEECIYTTFITVLNSLYDFISFRVIAHFFVPPNPHLYMDR